MSSVAMVATLSLNTLSIKYTLKLTTEMKARGNKTDKNVCSGSLINFNLKCTSLDWIGLPPSWNSLNSLMKKASASVNPYSSMILWYLSLFLLWFVFLIFFKLYSNLFSTSSTSFFLIYKQFFDFSGLLEDTVYFPIISILQPSFLKVYSQWLVLSRSWIMSFTENI